MLKKMARLSAIVLFSLVIVLLFAGCGPAETESEEQLILDGEGVLIGQIDSRSVEIEVDGRPTAFGLGEGVSVSGITDGLTVTFTYIEGSENERPVLLSIKAVDMEDQILWGEGIYTGQIDSQSVEIEVDGQPSAFALAEGVAVDDIIDGSRVIFTYRESDFRPLLLSIEMLEEPVGENGMLEGEGVFVGQIDSQSVEIMINRAFSLGEGVSVEEIDDGSMVAFTYAESEYRPILESIEAVDEPIEGEVMHGTFIGQIDGQSVEIQYYEAFVIGEGVNIDEIASGAKITFTYKVDRYRPVLTSVELK